MTEWKPKIRRKGLNPPWGYEPAREDPEILLPDKLKLDALEHSFRMRAKHNTSIRDCCLWLQANTGDSLTPAGYMYAYKKWVNNIRKGNGQRLACIVRNLREQKQKKAEELFKGFTVKFDDRESIYALAENQANKQIKEQTAR